MPRLARLTGKALGRMMLRTRIRVLLVLSFAFAMSGIVQDSGATTDGVRLITQPIATFETGIWIVDVPVISAGSLWDGAGAFVEMTSRSFPIEILPGAGSHPAGQNAAAVTGISVRLLPNTTRNSPPGLFGDTLRVELDLTGFRRSQLGLRIEDVTAATVHCMLVNAGRTGGIIKYLDLRIRGDRQFSSAGRVYGLRDFPEHCGARQYTKERRDDARPN